MKLFPIFVSYHGLFTVVINSSLGPLLREHTHMSVLVSRVGSTSPNQKRSCAAWAGGKNLGLVTAEHKVLTETQFSLNLDW